MRFIFKLIVVIDVFIVLAGILFIFDKIMRNRNIEQHFVFRPFEKNGKQGYGLFDDDDNCVYYGVKQESEDNLDVYTFKNCKSRFSSRHTVSEILRNENAPNNSKKTFCLDNDEIWGYLVECGYYLQTTIVDDNMTQYRLHKNGRTVGFGRKRKEKEGVYSIRTIEKDTEMIFIILFAVAKTDN